VPLLPKTLEGFLEVCQRLSLQDHEEEVAEVVDEGGEVVEIVVS
jgi:hypothetical protein